MRTRRRASYRPSATRPIKLKAHGTLALAKMKERNGQLYISHIIQSFETVPMRRLLVRPWTSEEVSKLRRLWASGLPGRVIGIRLRRSVSAVLKKANQLDLGPLGERRQPQ